MKVGILDFDYQSYIHGLEFLEITWILMGLTSAKSHKPHTFFHLLSGVWLLVGGVGAIFLFDSGLEVIKVFSEQKMINFLGAEEAHKLLENLKYIFPAISMAFGTRFIGNWIVAENPGERGG